MRILNIITALDCSSATRQLMQLSRGLVESEFQSQTVVLHPGGKSTASFRKLGIDWTSLRLPRWFNLLGLTELNALCGRFQPDVLHSWDSLATRYANLLHSANKARFHVVEQSSETRSRPKSAIPFFPFRRESVSQYAKTRFVVRTNAARDKWIRSGGVAEFCRVVYPAADGTASAGPTAHSRADFLRRFSLEEKDFVVAVIGHLENHGRHKDLIWATDMLKFSGASVHLLVFGDGPLRWRCEKFARQCEIADHVHFSGECDDVAEWLPHCDLLWQANDVAGSGNALVEAMNAGLPVVATDLPAHREFVVPEETGILLPVGRRAEFAGSAARLMSDRALGRRWGEAGRLKSRRDFSPDVLVQKYRQLYGELR